MQTKLDFLVSKHEVFRAFIETKKGDGYEAEKVNYTACATILKKETHRISIVPSAYGEIIGVEYEVGKVMTSENRAHRHPDDFSESRCVHRWERLKSYLIAG